MILSSRKLILVLAFPILALMLLTGYKSYLLNTGKEITLPITGYDPRDLLSGHYLIYQVDYGIDNLCQGTGQKLREAYVCLAPKQFSFSPIENCQTMIQGVCKRWNRFEAGIERFYIPEDQAMSLDRKVRKGKGSIIVSVHPSGRAQVKELLIDGRSWQSP